jgi:glycosyltransferase involved in cell wall biosynthesis
MTIAVILFGAVVVLESIFFQSGRIDSKLRTLILSSLVAITSVYLLFRAPNIIVLVVFIISFYRLFNLFRVVKKRMSANYLDRSTSRTSSWLISTQAVILIIYLLFIGFSSFGFLMHLLLYTVLTLQFILAIVVICSVVANRRRTTPRIKAAASSNLPTISVCIPARNESEDLRECLELVVASDYPKLEILVLDDCSSDKHTPEVIRSFAQSGVVFVPGTPPPSYWLAKNWAYDQLAKAANGEIFVFLGVDVRLSRSSLSNAVAAITDSGSEMISVIPRLNNINANLFVQTMRYWWELALPRQILKRPPVISTFWMINAEKLKKLGGFNATRRMITSEAHFAKQLIATQSYQFLRDSDVFGISTDKSSREQTDTAIRTRYPQLHKRPETVFLLSIGLFLFMIMPFVCAIVLWITSSWSAAASLLIVIIYIISYSQLIKSVRQQGSLGVATLFPVAVIIDLFLLHVSMFRYEFSAVEWKGRNVCIPVMHMTTANRHRSSNR